jgi:hypothetical protein
MLAAAVATMAIVCGCVLVAAALFADDVKQPVSLFGWETSDAVGGDSAAVRIAHMHVLLVLYELLLNRCSCILEAWQLANAKKTVLVLTSGISSLNDGLAGERGGG